eukprot:gene21903-27979_t
MPPFSSSSFTKLPVKDSAQKFGQPHQVIDLMSTDDDKSNDLSDTDDDDDDSIFGRLTPGRAAAANVPRNAPSNAVQQQLAARSSSSSSSSSSSAVGVSTPGPASGSNKRSLPAATTPQTNSAVKRIKVGNVEIKLEHEPLSFGQANIGDEVVEVRDPDAGDEDESSGNSASGGGGGSAVKKEPVVFGDDDLDIEFVGGNMNTAADMPHQREACPQHPFGSQAKNPQDMVHNIKFCPNCYCFVCDIKTSDCCDWAEHCHATHKDNKWRLEKSARNSRIMSLMSPVNKAAFFSANKAYLSSNTKAALGIRRFYGGGGLDVMSTMMASQNHPGGGGMGGEDEYYSAYMQAMGGSGGGKAGISPSDQQIANSMMAIIQSKLEHSGVQSEAVSLVGGKSSSAGPTSVEQAQLFLEASALLLKLLSMPSFPAWELEPVPVLFTAWVLHPRCTRELRGIYKEEIRALAMARTLSMGFRSLIRLLDVADLDFTWMKSTVSKSSSSSAKECVLPQDILSLCVEPIVSLLIGELSAQSKFAEMRTILAYRLDHMLKLKAAVSLIERGGVQRNEMAVDLLSIIDQPDFWGNALQTGDGKTLFNKLPTDKLLQFLALFIDTHLSPGAGMRIIRSDGLFQALFNFTLSKLFSSFRVVEVAEVIKCVSFFVDVSEQPPVSASAWLTTSINKKPVPILSPLECSAQALVLFAIYVRRRISATMISTLGHCKDLIHLHAEKSISGSSTILCITAANAMLHVWKFTSLTSGLVNAIDMNLFVAGEIAKKIFGGVNYDVGLHHSLDARIRDEWRRLPTVHCVAKENSLRSTLNSCGLSDAVPPTSSNTSGLRSFRFDTHKTDAAGPKEVVVSAAYASDVLRCTLYPAELAANITAYHIFGNSLKYGSIFYVIRNLVKQSAVAVNQKVNFACFVFQHLESLQMVWKGFLVNCLIYLFDVSVDAHTKYTMFYDFLQQVRKILNCFFDPASGFDLAIVKGWYAELSRADAGATSSASPVAMSTNDQCYLMCINMYVIGALNTVCSSYEPSAKQTILSDMKRFFLKLSAAQGDSAALNVHHQHLLGHMNVTHREVWSEFWCPFLRKIRFKIATTESAAIVNVILEDWDAVRQALSGANNKLQTESLLAKLGLLSEEDFALVALSGEASVNKLVDIVKGACRDAVHGLALIHMISLIIMSNASSRVSALEAIVRRFSPDIVGQAALAFIPYFASVVRGWSVSSDIVSSDKVKCFQDTLAAYETASATPQSDLIVAENMALSCAYLGQFQLAAKVLASSGLMSRGGNQSQFAPDRARILRDALLRCDSQVELESALSLFDSYLSSCYLDPASVVTMQPLIDKYSRKYPESGPAFKLLLFYHQYNEQAFEAYWAAVDHSDRVDEQVAAFMTAMVTSPRLQTRSHFLVMFRFCDEKDYGDYLSTLNVRIQAFDREQAVVVLLETAQKCGDVLRSALYLVVARFLINMPSLTVQIRHVLASGLDRSTVKQLLATSSTSPYQSCRVHSPAGHKDAAADDADSIPLDVALNLLLFINDPAQPEALLALKGYAGFGALKARVFVLLRDFAHPGPTISLLLQDREHSQLMDFLLELTEYEREGDCTLICSAVEQLSASITTQSLVPHIQLPHSPTRTTKSNAEQYHREFFHSHGLIRILGRFLAVVSERANLKDLSTGFTDSGQRIERCVSVLIQRISDLTSSDKLLVSYLKLCTHFSAANISLFVEQCNLFGYLRSATGVPALERAVSGNVFGVSTTSQSSSSSSSAPPVAAHHPPLSSLSMMLEAELQHDEEDADAMFIDELQSFADEAQEEDRADIVDSTLQMLLALKSNFASDLRKLGELFSVVSSRQCNQVTCLKDSAQFTALVHKLFNKPTYFMSENVAEVPHTVFVPKGLLWVPPKDAPGSNAAVYNSLLNMVVKHQLLAADAILVPMMQRLDNSSCSNAQVSTVTPTRQLKNEGVQRLIQGVHAINSECRNSWTPLYSVWSLHNHYSFDQLQLALSKVLHSPALPHWLSIMSAIVTNHIMRSYSIRNGNIMSITEVFRVIFYQFQCPAIGATPSTRRNIFGPVRSNELIDDMVANHSVDAQREMAAATTRSVYTVADIARYPQLMREITVSRANPLFDCQAYRPLWEEIMRTPAKVEFATLLQNTLLKVASYIAVERMAVRIKNAFEDFLQTFRRCFQHYGPGANALILAAKNNAKTVIRSKPAAVKMLNVLDEAVSE